MQTNLISTTSALVQFINDLGDCKGEQPSLYVDLEGNNLCRHGTVSLISILVEPQNKVYFIDVTTLKQEAFNTSGTNGRTLQDILQSEDIIKVFFDIRNDSDALFSLYGIRVAGVEDLQLMELASRSFSKKCVNGLAKCIEQDSTIGYLEKRNWRAGKDRGHVLFDPARGGSYAVFDRRPMPAEVVDYCAQDVALMPHLRSVYRAKLWDDAWAKIAKETEARVLLSRSPSYNGKGRHMALGPSAWMNWRPSTAERAQRTVFEVAGPAERREAPNFASPGDERIHNISTPRPAPEFPTVMQEASSIVNDRSSRYVGSDEEFGDGWMAENSDDQSDGCKDFTACDSECGYCGQCPY